jgi:hypothetical protein
MSATLAIKANVDNTQQILPRPGLLLFTEVYRLVSVVLRLATMVQAASGGKSATQHRDPVSDAPVQFVLPPSGCHPSQGEGKHILSFAGGLTIAVPASLVVVQQTATGASGLLGYRLGFQQTSSLAPVLNQLVHLVIELLSEVQHTPANVPA